MRKHGAPGQGGPRALRNGLVAALAVAAGLTLAWLAWPPERQWAASDGLAGMTGGEAPERQALPQTASQVSASTPMARQRPGRAAPLWGVADLSAVPNPPPYPDSWSKEGRALVRLAGDLAEARALGVGDPVSLLVPQIGAAERSLVEGVDGPTEARTLTGFAKLGGGRDRRWVVTVGKESLFAWLDTPQGVYELAVRDGGREGWMVPMASKLAGMDFSKPDYVLPGDARRGPGRNNAGETP